MKYTGYGGGHSRIQPHHMRIETNYRTYYQDKEQVPNCAMNGELHGPATSCLYAQTHKQKRRGVFSGLASQSGTRQLNIGSGFGDIHIALERMITTITEFIPC